MYNYQGTAAIVSTLLTAVGFAQSPEIAGKGGLMRISSFPFQDSINAVSSPQM
jgi:hypothetical protein